MLAHHAVLVVLCRLSVNEVLPLAQGILQGLFNAFQQPDSAENEYLMRAVMRLISFLGPQIAPVAPMCLQVGLCLWFCACRRSGFWGL